MNEEKSEFANDLYRLGKVAILRFAELLEKEGVNENTGSQQRCTRTDSRERRLICI